MSAPEWHDTFTPYLCVSLPRSGSVEYRFTCAISEWPLADTACASQPSTSAVRTLPATGSSTAGSAAGGFPVTTGSSSLRSEPSSGLPRTICTYTLAPEERARATPSGRSVYPASAKLAALLTAGGRSACSCSSSQSWNRGARIGCLSCRGAGVIPLVPRVVSVLMCQGRCGSHRQERRGGAPDRPPPRSTTSSASPAPLP